MSTFRLPPHRRRRLLALVGLVTAFAALALIVVAALGSGGDGDGGQVPAAVTRSVKATTATTTTTAVAGPTRTMGEPGPPRPVPILMYHVVSDPLPDSPYPDLYVPRAEFQDQMQALKDAGYTAVTLQEWWDSWHADGALPAKPVVVSFDDGYHSHLANALPVLRALGWPGVLNLELKNIRSDYGLTVPQVRALIAAGWELDSHTLSHPDLTKVGAKRLRRELVGSREAIARAFGVTTNFLCLPYGHVDAAVKAAVRAAGYLGATTTHRGLAAPRGDRFALPRISVSVRTKPAALLRRLR